MSYSSNYAVPATNLLDKSILMNLDATSATQIQTNLGDTVRAGDREFKHVKYESVSDVVVTAGMPAVWADTTGDYVVQADVSAAGGGQAGGVGKGCAGVFCVPIADENDTYCWIQTRGFCPGARVEEGVSANDSLQASTTDQFDTVNNVTSVGSITEGVICAFALGAATDASGGGTSTADVILFC